MKRILVLFTAAGLICPLSAQSYSREDLIRYAFEHAEAISLLQEEKEKIRLQRSEHRAGGFPQIAGSFGYQFAPKSYNPYELDMGGGSQQSIAEQLKNPADVLPNPDPGDELAYKNAMGVAQAVDGFFSEMSSFDLSPREHTLNWEVKLEQVIFAQGKIKTAVEIAEIAARSVDVQIEVKKFEIARDVTTGFNAWRVAHRNQAVAEGDLQLSRQAHEQSVLRFKSGQGTELDTLNSRYALKHSQSQLRSARMNCRLAKKQLLTLVSLEKAPEEVELTGELSRPELTMDFETARQKMLKNNRSLQSISVLQELRDKQISLSKTDFLPSLGAFASTGQTSQFNETDDIDFGWNIKAGAGLNIPIFAGGKRFHKVDQARMERRKVDFQRAEAVNKLTLALEAAFEKYGLARKEIAEADRMVALTEKGLEVASLSFEVGQITQIELDRSKQQVQKSRLAQNAALRKLNEAVAEIDVLTGDSELIQVD
ncbi:MAG: TolC family protein [Fibrobacterota bacterium]